jgi:lysophospholipase L1-like esterase
MRPVLVLLLAALTAAPGLAQTRRSEHWVATWATALVARGQGLGGRGQGPAAAPAAGAPAPAAGAAAVAPAIVPPGAPGRGAPAGPGAGGRRGGGPLPPVTIDNQTIRQVVRASIGGSRVRVVLSNVFGTAPLEIGAAHIGLRQADASLAGAARPLTFSGSAKATILPGAVLLSDAVDLAVQPLAELSIDLFVPGELGNGPSPVTTHQGAAQTNYLSPPGNHSGIATMPVSARTTSWFLLARVEVAAPAGAGAVVAFGDSITDGARSTTDMNARWPDHLARRLSARRVPAIAVLNAGISGNRVLGDGAGLSALARFDKDVLMQTGVTHVVIMEGINDIGIARSNPGPSAADLIAGHTQLIERARARGLRVYGATLTPFEGAAYWTPEGEAKRQALNEWIRTSGAYDGVIDFDMVTRDPAAPTKFLPAYDSGDHLHPGDAGYKAMGEAVDLALFGSGR